MQWTFERFMQGYGEYFEKRGETWLSDYIKDLMERSVSTYELVSYEIQELTWVMWQHGPERLADFGYAWSKRDRLIYMLSDWNTYLDTDKKYF